MSRRLIFIVCMLSVFSQSLLADSLSSRRVAELEKEAKWNDELAFNLGYGYFKGENGLAKDLQKAVFWLDHVANGSGSDDKTAKAAYLLGMLYLGEMEHPVNEAKALEYLRIASKHGVQIGLIDAPYRVAMLTPDTEEFFAQMEMSARAGLVPAMLELYNAHLSGKKGFVNDKAAVYWLEKAANAGYAPAQAEMGQRYFNGDAVYKDYDRAHYWLELAAQQGIAAAQSELGLIYQLGLGREVDLDKAMSWFEQSAAQEFPMAMDNLANLIIAKQDEKRYPEAAQLLMSAAEQGLKSAAEKLAEFYDTGTGVEKNPEQAAAWRAQAQRLDNSKKVDILLVRKKQEETNDLRVSPKAVEAYQRGVEHARAQEWESARKQFLEAAMLNLPSAQMDLGRVLLQLAIKDKDDALLILAYAWVKVAVDADYPDAADLAGKLSESFNSRMLEQAMRQYSELKEQLTPGK